LGEFLSPNIIRIIKSRGKRWARDIACMEKKKCAYSGLVGKPEGKIPLGRPSRWEDNIKMYLRQIG
jgi:hypothetical protein